MGERTTPMQREQLIRRQHMRIRTIAVSFAAAVTSARHDMNVSPAERDALIETWRAWSLDVLERYARDIRALSDVDGSVTVEEMAEIQVALDEAIGRVRAA